MLIPDDMDQHGLDPDRHSELVAEMYRQVVTTLLQLFEADGVIVFTMHKTQDGIAANGVSAVRGDDERFVDISRQIRQRMIELTDEPPIYHEESEA